MNSQRIKAARRLRLSVEAEYIGKMKEPWWVRVAYWFGFRGPYVRFVELYMMGLDQALKTASKKTARIVARTR